MKYAIVATIVLSGLFNALTLGDALPATAPSIGTLLQQRLDEKAKSRDLQKEQDQATRELRQQLQSTSQMLNDLTNPPKDDPLPKLRARQQAIEDNLKSLQQDLDAVKKEIELVQIKDPDARAQKTKDLTDQRSALRKQVDDASAPTKARFDDLQKPLKDTNAAMGTALSKFFKDGTGKYACKVQPLNWNDAIQTGQVRWKGAGDADLAWAPVSLLDKPHDSSSNNHLKIDDKYDVQIAADASNAIVWAGYFEIHLSLKDKTWQPDKTAMMELVKSLVDLDGLAALKPDQTK